MPKIFQSLCCRSAAALLALSGTFWGLTGCANKPAAAPSGLPALPAPQLQDTAAMTKNQKIQQSNEIRMYIQTLSPQERAAYFKSRPEAIKALTQ